MAHPPERAMALAELLRALETDAEARITEVREAAAAASARLQAEGRERLERRRTADLASREAELESEALRELEGVRLEGVRRVLTARARALEQLRALARSRLLESVPDS
ncbi:MAG TPA: hypothetical protein VMJ30_03150, partial [Gemmatimonadales bacterium]|nr:hypothetical protein [Gemmatimonadales bacterium]